MTTRVLVTNDDGIDGEGLRVLTATLVAHGFDPIVVAPDADYSGAGTSLIGGLVSYPVAALFMGSSKGAFFYISLFSVSCGAGCLIAFIVLKGIHIFQTNTIKEK